MRFGVPLRRSRAEPLRLLPRLEAELEVALGSMTRERLDELRRAIEALDALLVRLMLMGERRTLVIEVRRVKAALGMCR